MMEVSGKIKVLFDEQTFDSGFKKREFVVTTQEQYPQDIKIECIKDRCDLLNDLKVGDEVKAHINLRGNEYQGRYFVNLQAWRIDKGSDGAAAPASGAQEQPPFPDPDASVQDGGFSQGGDTDAAPGGDVSGEGDDLPF